LGIHAARLAIRDAALPSLRGGSIVVGSAIGATAVIEENYVSSALDGTSPDDAARVELWRNLSFHCLAVRLGDLYDCDGDLLTLSTGCTAGLDAVGAAYELIKDGDADLVLAGAAEAPITPIVFAAFDLIGALSTRNHIPH